MDAETRAEVDLRLSEPLPGHVRKVVTEAQVEDEMSLFMSATSGL